MEFPVKTRSMLLAAAASLLFIVPAQADCLGDIQAIMQNHVKAGPYHVTMEADMGGMKNAMAIDVILPSSFHMKGQGMESIMLKEGTWMLMGGKWMAMPGNLSAMVEQNVKSGLETGWKGATNAQCEGAQAIEGQTLNKFELDSSSERMGFKANSHVTLYANDKGLPQIIMVDGEAMGKKSHTVQHITYDPSIKITPPKLN